MFPDILYLSGLRQDFPMSLGLRCMKKYPLVEHPSSDLHALGLENMRKDCRTRGTSWCRGTTGCISLGYLSGYLQN